MPYRRTGSAILLCLGLASIAVMVGFAFLRAVSRQDISGTSEIIEGLARDAARSGLAHATEQIMADYNATSLKVAVNAASQPVGPVPTHLDGPYRAPFATLVKPGLLLYTQAGGANGTDDVQQENHLLMPFIRKDADGAGSRVAEAWFCDLGLMIYEGRGRYYEPGYHDTTRPDPASATPVPVATVRFTDPGATASDRTAPLFLDRNLRRLTGSTTSERSAARYRVRYAVGVEDLQGHLLANPRADMDIDWTKAGNDYRVIPPWLNQAGHVWNSMTSCVFGSKPTVPLRMDHVLRGRGSASNADRAWTPGTTWGQPAAFPWMFRAAGRERNRWTGGRYNHSTGFDQWWGNHTWDGNYCDSSLYDGVYDGTTKPLPDSWHLHDDPNPPFGKHGDPCYNTDPSPVANQENMGGRLYRYTGSIPDNPPYPKIDPNPAGGQILTPVTDTRHPYVHALLGPQVSWYNYFACIQGYSPGQCGDGWNPESAAGLDWMAKQSYHLTSYSPFGRRMQKSATTSGQKWYEGAVDSPWLVNALTATPQTVNQMLLAYLPPYLKTLKWTHEDWYLKTGETFSTDADGNVHVNDVFGPAVHHTVNGPWYSSVRGLETLNDQMGSGFADFPAPSSVDAGFTIKPDYYQDNPEPRPVADRYPGPLCRGDSTIAEQGSDDLGQHIDADSRGVGRCTHIGKPFMFLGGSDQWRIEEEGNLEPGKTWKRKWSICRRIDTLTYKYRYSYFWDLSYAMTQALAFARATWVQYPNSFFTPKTAFNPSSLRDPRPHDTLVEFDRLFLRQLGENYDNPGTPCPDEPIQQVTTAVGSSWDVFSISYTKASSKPAYTIASLAGEEDENGNGTLDPFEDRNSNGKFDYSEDLNHNGVLDPGEDQHPNGQLDPSEDKPNGILDPGEDTNGNGSLDPGEDKPNGVLDPGEDTGDGKLGSLLDTNKGVLGTERGKVMERMLNDFRLSYLGASPAYRSSFRPLDFDGDGKVHCSCYDRNTHPDPVVAAMEKTYKTDRWKPVDPLYADAQGVARPGRGMALTNLTNAGIDYPTGFSNDPWFCATGAFFIGKSHYYRVFVRGEVYDNLLKKPIASRTLESVLAVDPEATIDPHDGARPAGNQPYTQVLFQRWHHNDQTSELPRHVR